MIRNQTHFLLVKSFAIRFANPTITHLLTFLFWCSALDLSMGLLSAFTFDMRGLGLAPASTVLALSDWTAFLVDIGQWSI